MLPQLFLTAIGVLIFIYIWQQRRNYWCYWKIGGRLGLPLIGLGLEFSNQKNILKSLKSFRETHGTFGASWLGSNFVVYCSEPVIIKQILSSPLCIEKTEFFRGLESLMKNGILLAKTSKWSERRKILNPTFSHGILINLFGIYNEVTDTLIDKFQELTDIKNVYLGNILAKATLEIACQTTMGTKMNILQESNSVFFQDFHNELDILTRKLSTPWLQNETIFKMTNLFKLEQKYVTTIRNFTRTIISETRKNQNQNKKPDFLPSDFLNHQMDNENEANLNQKTKRIFIEQIFHYAENGTISWDDIEDEATTILLTGADTLASFGNSAILCLAMNPHCQELLREEIWSKFGKESLPYVSYEDIKDMQYLDMVVQEILRLMPPAPLIFRQVSKDYKLNNGIILPRNTQILIDSFHMHRDPKIWGPYAEKFYPEHFLPENISKVHQYAFIPYAKGIRSCIGVKYSQFVAKTMLIKLFHRYKITTNAKFTDLKYLVAISLKLQEDIKITIEDLRDK